jgi:hypothetical protein
LSPLRVLAHLLVFSARIAKSPRNVEIMVLARNHFDFSDTTSRVHPPQLALAFTGECNADEFTDDDLHWDFQKVFFGSFLSMQ